MKIKDSKTTNSDKAKSTAQDLNKEEAVDMDFLKDVTGGDQTFEKELFALYLDSAKNNLDKMEKALTDKDEDAWYMASHSFKGASASIGAFAISKVLEYAQTHPKDDAKNKMNLLTEIKAELARVAEFINAEIAKS